MGFDFIVAYKKGKENLAADALSRIHERSEECTAIIFTRPAWKDEVLDSLKEDILAQDTLAKLSIDDITEVDGFQLINGDLKYKGRY